MNLNSYKREAIERKLFKWGAWKDVETAGRVQSQWEGMVKILKEGGHSEGYDSTGMSDYDAEMVLVDRDIQNLNVTDREIVNHKYRYYTEDAARLFEAKHGRISGYFKDRLSVIRRKLGQTILDY